MIDLPCIVRRRSSISGWGVYATHPIAEDTRIVGDLDFESVMIVEFCMAVGKHFRKKLPFQNLVFQDGRFQDFTVGQLVTFLDGHLTS